MRRIRSWLRERRYRKWETHYLEDPWRRQRLMAFGAERC